MWKNRFITSSEEESGTTRREEGKRKYTPPLFLVWLGQSSLKRRKKWLRLEEEESYFSCRSNKFFYRLLPLLVSCSWTQSIELFYLLPSFSSWFSIHSLFEQTWIVLWGRDEEGMQENRFGRLDWVYCLCLYYFMSGERKDVLVLSHHLFFVSFTLRRQCVTRHEHKPRDRTDK